VGLSVLAGSFTLADRPSGRPVVQFSNNRHGNDSMIFMFSRVLLGTATVKLVSENSEWRDCNAAVRPMFPRFSTYLSKMWYVRPSDVY